MLNEPLNSKNLVILYLKLVQDPDDINDKDAIIEFFPDRPDLLSTEGVARALRAFTEQELGLIDYKTNAPTTHMVVSPEVLGVRPHVLGEL